MIVLLREKQTMTSINTFQDILEAMERDPQLRAAMRGHILGEEFMQMPAAVNRLETNVAGLQTSVNRLETDVTGLQTSVNGLETKVDGLETKVDRLETKVDGLESKVDGLETKVDGLESKVTDLQVGQERVEGRLDRLEGGQRRMDGRIGNLEGAQYEMRVSRFFPNTARRDLNLSAAKVLQSHNVGPDSELTAMIEQAEERQAITVEEGYLLGVADVILQGINRANQEFTYAVAEISRTIAQHDIHRAVERARILAAVTGCPTLASVVGTRIDDRNRQQADEAGVVAILLRE